MNLMPDNKYTELPYVFDLLYDFKSLEALHDHLSGKSRAATSGTDRDLRRLMIEYNLPLPEKCPEVPTSVGDFALQNAELLDLLSKIHAHVKQSYSSATPLVDKDWILRQTGLVLAKQDGISEEDRQAFLG